MFNNEESDSDDEYPLNCFINKNLTGKLKDTDGSYDSLCEAGIVCCDFCDRIFANRFAAIKHTKDHIIIPLRRPTLYECPTCLYYFTSQSDFNQHNLKKHESLSNNNIRNRIQFEEDVEVPSIVLSSDCESEIEVVPEKESGSADFRCKYCPYRFSTKYKLLLHNVYHIKIDLPKVHLCTFCEGYFESESALNYHCYSKHMNLQPTDIINTKCKQCHLPFLDKTKHEIKYHLSPKSDFTCSTCNEAFDNEIVLNNHRAKHFVYVNCQECQEIMKACDLNKHILEYHNKSQVCDTCLLFFNARGRLRYQYISEVYKTGQRIICECCSKEFFKLNVIQRFRKYKKTQLESDWQDKRPFIRKSKKILTNSDRLKNIQQRLKVLSKLNKF